jgi:hypothetical protein
VEDALESALRQPDEGGTPGSIHRNRSKCFVETLATRFRQLHGDQGSIRVLSKHCGLHRDEFGLNELLFDILVCDTSSVPSARGSASLTFITKALWVVESEFARDARQALFDFNKLVLASADSKLFVGPMVTDEQAFLGTLLAPATRCGGQVFVALIPHPAGWPQARARVHRSAHVYRLEGSEWQAVCGRP